MYLPNLDGFQSLLDPFEVEPRLLRSMDWAFLLYAVPMMALQ